MPRDSYNASERDCCEKKTGHGPTNLRHTSASSEFTNITEQNSCNDSRCCRSTTASSYTWHFTPPKRQ